MAKSDVPNPAQRVQTVASSLSKQQAAREPSGSMIYTVEVGAGSLPWLRKEPPEQAPSIPRRKHSGPMIYAIEKGAGWLPWLRREPPEPTPEQMPAIPSRKPSGPMIYTIENGAGWLPWLKK